MTNTDKSDKNPQNSTYSAGNINNAGNVNIGGKQDFRGDVTISISHQILSDKLSDPSREELHNLLKDLELALQQLPPEKAEDAELVQEYANDAVEEVAKEAPRRKKLEITGENLKKAAENLLNVSPIAVKIAQVLLQIST